jgi:hypothetical protein
MATSVVCEICGTALTMWNRAGWPNKLAICSRCYRGVTPEARKKEAADFFTSHPTITAESMLHYSWGDAISAFISHTLLFLVCVWIGAYFGGWILGLVGGFVGMFIVLRLSMNESDIITKRRVQMHDGVMISSFWLIFFVNWFYTLFQLMDRDYSGTNPILMLWLVPTLLAPLLGLVTAWLTDRARLRNMSEGLRSMGKISR